MACPGTSCRANNDLNQEEHQMRNLKVLGLALIAVFAFGVVAAGAAQANAPRWTVTENSEAKTLSATETREFTSKSTTGFTLGATGVASFTSPSCTASGTIRGSEKGQPGTNENVVLHCTEVKVEGNKNCVVHSPGAAGGTVATEPLSSTLVWLSATSNDEVGDTFKPVNANNLFVTLEVEKCVLEGHYPVIGNFIAKVEPVTEHKIEGQLTAPVAQIHAYWNNETPTRAKQEDAGLTLKAKAATFTGWNATTNTAETGVMDVTLANNVEWGIEPG